MFTLLASSLQDRGSPLDQLFDADHTLGVYFIRGVPAGLECVKMCGHSIASTPHVLIGSRRAFRTSGSCMNLVYRVLSTETLGVDRINTPKASSPLLGMMKF